MKHQGPSKLIAGWDDLPVDSWEQKVAVLAYRMSLLPKTPLALKHELTSDLYVRELRVPGGMLLCGRKHLKGHTIYLASGSAVVITSTGRFTFRAPSMFTSEPGFYMVAQTLTDCVVRTLHPNPSTLDLAALENEWFEQSDNLIAHGKHICQEITKPFSEKLESATP